ncbi:FMN-binding negative transcriptional regulator [candidate division KSB1 bacterium]|nr:FMN-binding negative transcriptional regulator [candidate division KSB1 bacterium]
MYQRPDFVESREQVLDQFIHEHSFATLVSQHKAEPFATPLPLLLTVRSDGSRVLEGHIAVSNPQWRSLESQSVLAIFHGPHGYVSPSWYDTRREVAPTWNYVTAHVYGVVRLHTDPVWLEKLLRRLIEKYESRLVPPWTLEQADPQFIQSLYPHIVGLELEVARIEGKFKLNQNRTAKDRDGVIAHLKAHGDADGKEIARYMEERRGEGKG